MRIYVTTRPGWLQESRAVSITDPQLFERMQHIAEQELTRTRATEYEVYALHENGQRVTIAVNRVTLFQTFYDFRTDQDTST